MKKSVFLILFAVLVMLSFFIASVSAQEIDVDSLDNEELTALLLQILGKLQQEETPSAEKDPEVQETPASAEAPVPVSDPGTVEEVLQITIYDNKKLSIEALPEYMFIRPTEPPKPEPKPGSKPKPGKQPDNTPEHYENEPGIDDIDGGPCTWSFWDGQWRCMKG